MVSNPFIIVYFLGILIGSIIRVKYTKPYKDNKIKTDHKTIIDKILMTLPGIGMFILPLLYVSSSWFDFAGYNLPQWAGWIGIALFVLMLWMLWRSHYDLRSNWAPSLQIMENHLLVTHGVYKYVRHPMYAAHLLWGIAQPLLLQNWIVGLSMLVTLLPLYFYRIPREERMMLDHFGEKYRNYMGQTDRIILPMRKLK